MNRIHRLIHRFQKCDFTFKTEEGVGFYQKGEQQLEIEIAGHKGICRCGRSRFFPTHPDMRPVEIQEAV